MRKIQIAGYGIESAELPEDSEVLMQEGENLEEATEALEAFALLLQPAVEGYAVNPAALAAVSAVTNRLVRKAGLPTLSVGTESLVVDTVQQAASLGLEDIKEHLKNAGKAVIEFLKKIGKWIAEKFSGMLDAAASKISAAKEAISSAAYEAYNSKKLIDVSHFYIDGKLNGTELSKALEHATSDAGYLGLVGTAEEGFPIGIEVSHFAMTKFKGGSLTASSPEAVEFIHKRIKQAFEISTRGIKRDADGWVTNWPGKVRLGVRFSDESDEKTLTIQRLHRVYETKNVETTLEKVGISVESAGTILKNLSKYEEIVKGAALNAKKGNKAVEDVVKSIDDNQEAANFMRRYYHSLFSLVQFQGDASRNIVNTLGEISRAIRSSNAK
jgi:hypothetical protein